MGELNVEVEQETLAAQAYEEIAAEKEGREPANLLSTPKKDEKKKEESSASDDEQAKDGEKDGDAKDGNEDKADEKADEKATEDEKTDEEAGDSDKEADESADKKAEDGDQDKKISEYAEKHSMTYAEAKEDLEKTAEILKQYKNDPAEMAKAMRNKDREYHKLKAEAEKANAKKEPVYQRMTESQFIAHARTFIPEKHPEMIEKYRADFPAKSESMSDEAIVEEVAQLSLSVYNREADKKEAAIKETASKKRDELIAGVPVADRRFIPEVKALLLETSDASVLSEGFGIQDALYWAKGKAFDAEVKAAEERGFKRAKEGGVILGTKPMADGSKGSGGSKTSGGSLNLAQKQRAEQMFGNTMGVNGPEDCYKLFKETFEDELKKDPKFV